MRKLVYYVASTLDGFIAHEDGSFDGFTWGEDFGADLFSFFPETIPAHLHPDGLPPEQNQQFDTVLMGRKTYEVGLNEGITNPYPSLEQYVFSRSMTKSPDARIHLIANDAAIVVRTLKQQPGKDIWLCGGGDLASMLQQANLIDQLIIKLNPVLFGKGIQLFSNPVDQTALELSNSKVYDSGHIILFYNINN